MGNLGSDQHAAFVVGVDDNPRLERAVVALDDDPLKWSESLHVEPPVVIGFPCM
jgi:hypothetical protein